MTDILRDLKKYGDLTEMQRERDKRGRKSNRQICLNIDSQADGRMDQQSEIAYCSINNTELIN